MRSKNDAIAKRLYRALRTNCTYFIQTYTKHSLQENVLSETFLSLKILNNIHLNCKSPVTFTDADPSTPLKMSRTTLRRDALRSLGTHFLDSISPCVTPGAGIHVITGYATFSFASLPFFLNLCINER